jgi:cytochrome c-type biogenesis protein CcmH/NrfF
MTRMPNAHRIFSELMSPYCPGLMLADCPSPDAFELRAEIRARLAAGDPPAQVKENIRARFESPFQRRILL